MSNLLAVDLSLLVISQNDHRCKLGTLISEFFLFKTKGFMSSGLAALSISKFDNNLRIPFELIVITLNHFIEIEISCLKVQSPGYIVLHSKVCFTKLTLIFLFHHN